MCECHFVFSETKLKNSLGSIKIVKKDGYRSYHIYV